MSNIKIPANYRAVKYGTELIGIVSKKPEGMFGHYVGMTLNDGQFHRKCGTHHPARAIEIIRDEWERINLPQRVWKVLLANGYRCFVMAANEEQAMERASYRLRKMAEKELKATSACVDDQPEEGLTPAAINLTMGLLAEVKS